MRIVSKISAMQRLARQWQRAGKKVVFVPTMGFLHRGHASLMERARQLAGRKGRVVVSVYVNPTQFGPNEDFARYPRDVKGDQHLCRAAGVDVFFAPASTSNRRCCAELVTICDQFQTTSGSVLSANGIAVPLMMDVSRRA